MSETQTTSQAQQIPGMEFWTKAFGEQATRLQGMFDEVGKAQAKWAEQGRARLDAVAELMKAQLDYANELGADLRKLMVETAKKQLEAFTR